MSINIAEPFEQGWKRIILEQVDYAIKQLKENEDRHDAIHEVRKVFKKVRAALRLVRSDIKYYKKENVFFRDQGRLISKIRDYSSIQEALAKLEESNTQIKHQPTFNSLLMGIVERREALEEEVLKKDHTLDRLRESLEKKQKEINSWPVKIKGFKTIGKGIKKVYKRGMKASNKARSSRRSTDFHEWRKRAKYLQYQLLMLKPLWPDFMDAWSNEIHDLTDLLGLDHDLALLEWFIKEDEMVFPSKAEEEWFYNQLHQAQKEIRVKAILQGKRCYSEDTDQLLNRLENYWKVYQEEVNCNG
ncbi:CHAD domain-containing protein [Echinicola jeungdonensis]|uniref:CHAD domain-containing protein n=1 Tax=Echinicola jeungdonensis TaxID=709343 RepID=A0ABV5J2W8_9BACT|nr:CHAD domain-containing protein [Echinicola jeungdonensis]MDN3671059.1 CHAD domain-containing protein [Echinicola jeungdonensis]